MNLDEFRANIGNADIPVFDVPFPFLKKTSRSRTEVPQNDGRAIHFENNYLVSESQFKDLSRVYEGAYFMTGNLLDPARLSELSYMSQSLIRYMEGQAFAAKMGKVEKVAIDAKVISLDVQSILARQKSALERQYDKPEEGENILDQLRQRGNANAEAFLAAIQKQQLVEKGLQESLQSYIAGQRASGRIKRLLASMMAPNARASDLIEGSLVGVMAKLRQSTTGETSAQILHWLIRHPMISLSGITTAAVALVAPEAVATSLRQALNSLDFVYDPLLSMIKNTSLAVWQSTVDSSAILINTKETMTNQYFRDGNWWRLTVGLTALVGTLITVIGGYHSVASHVRLARDLKKDRHLSLVARQETLFVNYYEMLARSERQRREHENETIAEVGLTEEETKLVEKKLEGIETLEKYEKEIRSQLWHRRIGRWVLSPLAFFPRTLQAARGQLHQWTRFANDEYPDNKYIKSKWQALSSIVFSYASYSQSVLDLVKFWNGFSRFRYSLASWGFFDVFSVRVPAYIKLHPQILAYQLAYPHFFNRAVVKESGAIVPSILNGGMTPAAETLIRWLGSQSGLISAQDAASYQKAVEHFEDSILEIEKSLIPKLTWAALEALGSFVSKDSDVALLVSGKGVNRISEEVVQRLSAESQRFVRVYYELLYQRVMEKLLQQVLRNLPGRDLAESLNEFSQRVQTHLRFGGTTNYELQGHEVMSDLEIDETRLESLSLSDLKEVMVRHRSESGLDFKGILAPQLLVSWINEETRGSRIMDETLSVINNDRLLLAQVQRKYKTLSVIDPEQNGSFKRYAVVQEKSKDPIALARAIKFEISQMLVTLPIDIGVKLLSSAGIYEGLYRPIQQSMFGENSIFYLSQMSFYNGVVFGVFISLFANSWYKIQENAFHDAAGELGIVPRGKDAEKSYFRWFMKMSFGKKNSLFLNYKRYSSLVFWNLPASMVLFGVFQPLFLGRIDMEAIMVGYAVGFLTPVAAFRMKMEQGFERSSYYDGRHFTEREMASPSVQRFLESRIQKRRNRFNLITDSIMNWVEGWASNIFFVPVEGVGPRGFFRSLFAGWLPTEILVDRTRFVSYQVADIPVLNSIADSLATKCEMIFARGNPDLVKIR
jgi:hypothetical protein